MPRKHQTIGINVDIMPTGAAASTYIGPGDILTFSNWWGLRAYSLSSIGGNVVTLRRSSDNATKTFTSQANGGIDTLDAFFDGSSYFVTVLFDQASGMNDEVQTTAANQPGFVQSGVGGRPAMTFATASQQFLYMNVLLAAGIIQPFGQTAVAEYINNGIQSGMLLDYTSPAYLGFNISGATPDTVFIYAGTVGANATASDGNWHSISGLYNTTASSIMVDGATTSGLDPGVGSIISGDSLFIGFDGVAYANMNMTETGLIAGDSSASYGSLYTNEHNYYGGAF